MSRSPSLLVIAALVAGTACQKERDVIDNVTAVEGAGFCRIRVGDMRDHMLLRCGPPCGGGVVAKGKCPGGKGESCPNQCDLYFDVEVCFVDARAVSVRRLDRAFDRFEWCVWPDQPEPKAKTKRPARAPR